MSHLRLSLNCFLYKAVVNLVVDNQIVDRLKAASLVADSQIAASLVVASLVAISMLVANKLEHNRRALQRQVGSIFCQLRIAISHKAKACL